MLVPSSEIHIVSLFSSRLIILSMQAALSLHLSSEVKVLPPVQGQQYAVHFRFLPFGLSPDPRLGELHLHFDTDLATDVPFHKGTLVELTEQILRSGP